VIHRMMERAVADASFDPRVLIDQWMEEEHVPVRFKDDLLRGFTALNSANAVVEAKRATEKHCEWEFFRTMDGRIITGVIDLVYRSPRGGWIIIDYKTDDISDPARKRILDEYYAKQVNLYAESFAAITGDRVAGTEILYVDAVAGERGE